MRKQFFLANGQLIEISPSEHDEERHSAIEKFKNIVSNARIEKCNPSMTYTVEFIQKYVTDSIYGTRIEIVSQLLLTITVFGREFKIAQPLNHWEYFDIRKTVEEIQNAVNPYQWDQYCDTQRWKYNKIQENRKKREQFLKWARF